MPISSKLKRLTLKALEDVDFGKASLAFQQNLTRAVHDCINRPGDKRKRKIELHLELEPVSEVDGNIIACERTKGKFKILCKLPVIETDPVDFGINNDGDLVFNPDSPKDFRQATFLDDEDDES